MESFFIFLGWVVVLGGGAWAGAKAAFVVTLILQGLFGRATQKEQKHVVYVQAPPRPQYYYTPHQHGDLQTVEVVDVTPNR